jgi:hypothetical protein
VARQRAAGALAKCVGEGENGPFVASFRNGDQIRLFHTTDQFRTCPITAVAWRLTGKRYEIARYSQPAVDIGLSLSRRGRPARGTVPSMSPLVGDC